MALHLLKRRSIVLVRTIMASRRCSSSFSLHCHSSDLFNPRVSCVKSRGSLRAFMSFTTATDDSYTQEECESESSKAYSSNQIQVMEGLSAVRKSPGMYIGNTGSDGLHHLVYEILDNAIDEAQAGFASMINVVLHSDNSVSITDNGRGIPTEHHPLTNKSSLETVMTLLHAGGKFGGPKSGYSVSGGLHGVGLSVANALSEWLEVTVWRNGMEYKQRYSRGSPVSSLERSPLPVESKHCTKTCIRFLPDNEVFTTAIEFDHETIALRVMELAFLNPELTITLEKEDDDPEKIKNEEYCFAGGLVEYVKWLNREKDPLHDVISFSKEIDGMTVNVALQWSDVCSEVTILGYANSIHTIYGGTHIDGFKASLTKLLKNLAKNSKIMKNKDVNLSGEHIREGLTAIISVKVPNPEFEGQTKTRLGNPEVRKVVDQSLQEFLTEYLELHTVVLNKIISKSLNALEQALAANKAREVVRVKSLMHRSTIAGGILADCISKNPEECEIFLVEGNSAGGTAKLDRDRKFQAVLPIMGKILNIQKQKDAAIYKNKEIQHLICALNLGKKGEDFKKENLRYHKIIILTDADVDGAHIRALLLNFFYRYQKSLYHEGCIYVAVPPLYKVDRGKETYYCYSDEELEKLKGSFLSKTSYNVQRFKGLGEMMPPQLWETTMDPERRMMKKMAIEDRLETERVFSTHMGREAEGRKTLIEKEICKKP